MNFGSNMAGMDFSNMDYSSILGSTPSPDFSSMIGNGANSGFALPSMGSPAAAGGFGMNLPTLNGIVGGIGALGSLWGGLQQQKMAKKAFKFQKNMSLINLANQVKSYNTALADRSRSRGVMESQSQAAQDQYVRDNSLSTKR